MKPLARSDRLIKHVVGQDTLVYDPADDSACCLNSLATLVWRHCDGVHSVADLARVVAAELDLPDEVDPEDVVFEVLDELQKHKLLATAAADVRAARRAHVPRRDVVRALAMLPLFPVIQQITAPSVVHAGSPPPTGSATPTSTATPPVSPSITASITRTVTPSATNTTTPTATSIPPTPTATRVPPTPTPSST